MDEQTLDVLVKYTTGALRVCNSWTHSDILLALSATVYGNGPHCYQVPSRTLSRELNLQRLQHTHRNLYSP